MAFARQVQQNAEPVMVAQQFERQGQIFYLVFAKLTGFHIDISKLAYV